MIQAEFNPLTGQSEKLELQVAADEKGNSMLNFGLHRIGLRWKSNTMAIIWRILLNSNLNERRGEEGV